MASGNDIDDDHTLDGDQDAGVPIAKQMVPRTLVNAIDQRLRWVEQLVEDLIGRFDAMEVDANRGRIDVGRRHGIREEYGGPINQPIHANRWAQISDDDS